MSVYMDDRQSKVVIGKEIKDIILNVINKALDMEGVNELAEVSVVLVDNEEIKYLNDTFRGINKETDVLSFPQFEDLNDIKTNSKELILGDIVISLEKANEQALEFSHTFEREIAFLTAHSMFHLFGFDHDSEENTKIMRKKEERLLMELGILR